MTSQAEVNIITEDALTEAEDGIVREQAWSPDEQSRGRQNLNVDLGIYVTREEMNEAIRDAINEITIVDDVEF